MKNGDLGRIREAIQFTDANDREKWVRIGMAFKSAHGGDGFELWEEWSQQSDFFNSKDARIVWKNIRGIGPITISALFHEAKLNGWRDNGDYLKPDAEALAERRRIAAERAYTAKKACTPRFGDVRRKPFRIIPI